MKLDVIWPDAGRYILAVSGGADSMVMLDMLSREAKQRGYDLSIGHFDHGIRPESTEDCQFVLGAGKRYELPVDHTAAKLGAVNEAVARKARHVWLQELCLRRGADAVITAHHLDDLLETSLMNLARGSGRRGLAPMHSGPVLRPLIDIPRKALREYAQDRQVVWREDPSNSHLSNPRNYLRHKLLPSASPEWQSRYLRFEREIAELNKQITQSLSGLIHFGRQLDGSIIYDSLVVREMALTELQELILASCLALRPDVELDSRLVQEVALFAKTGRPHRRRPLRDGLELSIEHDQIRINDMQLVTNAPS